jgi:hypothetical protein
MYSRLEINKSKTVVYFWSSFIIILHCLDQTRIFQSLMLLKMYLKAREKNNIKTEGNNVDNQTDATIMVY